MTRVIWALAVAIPLLALLAELLPVVFGTGEKATWDWAFLYVTIRFVALPFGGPLAGVTALVVTLVSGGRTWRRLLPAVVLLLVAVAYDAATLVFVDPFMWLWRRLP